MLFEINMANYICEDDSICTKYQSAICLHCNHRLCLFNIGEHNKILISSLTNLSNEVKITFQQITEESEKRKIIFNSILTSFNQWQEDQIEKIQEDVVDFPKSWNKSYKPMPKDDLIKKNKNIKDKQNPFKSNIRRLSYLIQLQWATSERQTVLHCPSLIQRRLHQLLPLSLQSQQALH